MTILKRDENLFEAGTTITSKIRVKDEETGDITNVDKISEEPDITLEIINPENDTVVRQEETMDEKTDDDGNPYYIDSWSTSGDADLGEYHLIHRATVNEEDYRLTRIVELVEAKDTS